MGWSYYGEKCFEYLFGSRSVTGYRVVFTCSVLLGSGLNLALVWSIADVFNGLMAIPNLIGLIGLSGVVVAESKAFTQIIRQEKERSEKE